jgi:hypothetical protein
MARGRGGLECVGPTMPKASGEGILTATAAWAGRSAGSFPTVPRMTRGAVAGFGNGILAPLGILAPRGAFG